MIRLGDVSGRKKNILKRGMIMKESLLYYLVVLIVVTILIGTCIADRVIVIKLVIPKDLLPYYDWLISFPGIKNHPATPAPDKTPMFNSYWI
jgi:hypothetical protein